MRRVAVLAAVVALVFGSAGAAAATPGPDTAPEYWFDSWHVQQLWDSGVRGQGVTIAEIDTGVNAALPELSGRVLRGRDFGEHGDGRVDRELDAFGHGTAMASIMVARPGLLDITGLAPDAQILPLAVPLNGTSDSGRPGKLAVAIRYAADHGADVINMSLGGKRFKQTDGIACPDDEQRAIYHALRRGAVVVAAVGNTGPAKNTIEEPAVCLGVVAVGAVDAAGNVARFSGRQPFLTLVAPGVSVPSLGRIAGQAYSGDGTSQAAAIVSAVFALLRSKYPQDSGRQLVTRVLATLDAHRRKASPAYGYGLLDAYRAITTPVPADAPNPVYDAVSPFLAQSRAPHPKKLKVPAPAAPPRATTGHYEVGSSARLHTPQVITGGVIALAGLLALVLLLIVGTRRRRVRLAAAIPAPVLPLWERADQVEPSGPALVREPEVASQADGPIRGGGPDADPPRPSPLPRPRPRPGPPS